MAEVIAGEVLFDLFGRKLMEKFKKWIGPGFEKAKLPKPVFPDTYWLRPSSKTDFIVAALIYYDLSTIDGNCDAAREFTA